MQPRALITGITGQDGAYLARFLVDRGVEVHGLVRRTSTDHHSRLHDLLEEVVLHRADLLDSTSLVRLVDQLRPQTIYNLAGQSSVPASFDQPILTAEVTGLGVMRMLEAIRHVDRSIRFFQASSSEMFGKVRCEPQDELTPFYPRSPYGTAKAFGHWATINYRESYGIYAVSGILFNHESPLRGQEFVTRKITRAVARIACGNTEKLKLGNLDAQRDWGFAGDYVRAMWMMMQQPAPDDYVIATGEMHSVREFAELAFRQVGLNWQEHVEIDPSLLRPAEVQRLRGDASKAKRVLGWEPEVNFPELVRRMVEADLALEQRAARG